jgi:DNA uptake protein ComE-like DNA-binding protein
MTTKHSHPELPYYIVEEDNGMLTRHSRKGGLAEQANPTDIVHIKILQKLDRILELHEPTTLNVLSAVEETASPEVPATIAVPSVEPEQPTKVNVNTASEAELIALPVIGDKRAARIIENRGDGYVDMPDLVSRAKLQISKTAQAELAEQIEF